MNAYTAYIQYIDGKENWWVWYDMGKDIGKFIFSYKVVEEYIKNSSFLNDSYEDFYIHILNNISETTESFLFDYWNKTTKLDEEVFYEELSEKLYISFNFAIETFIGEIRSTETGPNILISEFDLKEDSIIREFNSTTKKILNDFFKLNLNKDFFKKIISMWDSNNLVENIEIIEIKKPIIKKIDYVDLELYKILISNPDLLKTMDWRLFELLLADILTVFQYEIQLTQPTKDGGIDIIAINRNSEFGKHKYLLQAKRYKENKVQIDPVRSILFLHDEHKATKSCLATTAHFTKGAWQLAERYKWQLELKDFDGILNWIERAFKHKKG